MVLVPRRLRQGDCPEFPGSLSYCGGAVELGTVRLIREKFLEEVS